MLHAGELALASMSAATMPSPPLAIAVMCGLLSVWLIPKSAVRNGNIPPTPPCRIADVRISVYGAQVNESRSGGAARGVRALRIG